MTRKFTMHFAEDNQDGESRTLSISENVKLTEDRTAYRIGYMLSEVARNFFAAHQHDVIAGFHAGIWEYGQSDMEPFLAVDRYFDKWLQADDECKGEFRDFVKIEEAE